MDAKTGNHGANRLGRVVLLGIGMLFCLGLFAWNGPRSETAASMQPPAAAQETRQDAEEPTVTPEPSQAPEESAPGDIEVPEPETTEEQSAAETEEEAAEEEEHELTWREKFADQFTDGEVVQTPDSYRSANLAVQVQTVSEKDVVYHVADVYVADIACLRSAFANDTFGNTAPAEEIARAHDAVVAISGDHVRGRPDGIVIRNGELYRDSRFEDICVLYADGVMETIPAAEVDLDALLAREPWQVWSFGPELMRDGKAREGILHIVSVANPRSAIGYVEPGHYVFIQVDGRGAFGSRGLTLDALAKLFEELGCTVAYNLDGGQTASMTWMGELISYPYGRYACDIIYVCDTP